MGIVVVTYEVELADGSVRSDLKPNQFVNVVSGDTNRRVEPLRL